VGIDITGEIGRRVMSQDERPGREVGTIAAAGDLHRRALGGPQPSADDVGRPVPAPVR